MKLLKQRFLRINVFQISIILIIIGLFFGVFSANMFRSLYYERMMDYNNDIFNDIIRENIDYKGLFIYILGNNLKKIAVFWLLSITILGIPYIVYKLIAFGFTTGFFISSIAIQYGIKGILLILVYVFPHGIVYLPIIIICLHRGYILSKMIYFENRDYMAAIRRLIKSYILLWLFLIIFLVLGSLLEAYIGSFLLKKTLVLIT